MTHDEMTALTEGLSSKSDKIRSLSRAGVPTAEIADFLGIRYQFAYNVIKSSENARSSSRPDAIDAEAQSSNEDSIKPSLETLIRLAHSMGFTVTFHPIKER